MDIIVPIIIGVIVCIQIFFFIKNINRMIQFKNIFNRPISWFITKDSVTGLVNGINGQGNYIFQSIINSINKYLGYNTGSVIDFGLLKDAVDRHCDSIENDISTQTPIPLYLGLAGTMAGVIIGLWDLIDTGAISDLMGSSIQNSIQNNGAETAKGITALLSGVAWAMVASIFGIIFTTSNSIFFKHCKLKEEGGKNTFLAWMQSELLPELPSDISQALTSLVRNLNSFNDTFANNTINLGNALNSVNESYAIQADIIKTVHEMDVMKIAKYNVKVLQELKECTEKLEIFNSYLAEVEGYTEAIHRFETLFNEQAGRLRVLEEIRDFFSRHKSEIARSTADVDAQLQDALESIKNSTNSNVTELHNRFVEQSETFKTILNEEKESFQQISSEIKTQFSSQLETMPQLYRQLEEIRNIPSKLDRLIERVEQSQQLLANHFSSSVNQLLLDLRTSNKQQEKEKEKEKAREEENSGLEIQTASPTWIKITCYASLIIIALTCLFNVVTYFINN